jgi:hypothetical protein
MKTIVTTPPGATTVVFVVSARLSDLRGRGLV